MQKVLAKRKMEFPIIAKVESLSALPSVETSDIQYITQEKETCWPSSPEESPSSPEEKSTLIPYAGDHNDYYFDLEKILLINQMDISAVQQLPISVRTTAVLGSKSKILTAVNNIGLPILKQRRPSDIIYIKKFENLISCRTAQEENDADDANDQPCEEVCFPCADSNNNNIDDTEHFLSENEEEYYDQSNFNQDVNDEDMDDSSGEIPVETTRAFLNTSSFECSYNGGYTFGKMNVPNYETEQRSTRFLTVPSPAAHPQSEPFVEQILESDKGEGENVDILKLKKEYSLKKKILADIRKSKGLQ